MDGLVEAPTLVSVGKISEKRVQTINVLANSVELGKAVLLELTGNQLGKVEGLDLGQHMTTVINNELNKKCVKGV